MKQKKPKTERPAAAPAPKGGFRHSAHADIPEEALTFREQRVLAGLRAAKGPMTVRELARKCFPGMRAKPGTYETTDAKGKAIRHATAAAYRCVLNAMRRLVVGGFAQKVERGTYVATRPNGASDSDQPVILPARRPRRSAPQPDTQEIQHE